MTVRVELDRHVARVLVAELERLRHARRGDTPAELLEAEDELRRALRVTDVGHLLAIDPAAGRRWLTTSEASCVVGWDERRLRRWAAANETSPTVRRRTSGWEFHPDAIKEITSGQAK